VARETETSRLPEQLLRRVRERIAEHAGLEPPDWVLTARLSQRAGAVGRRPDDYVDLVTSDAGSRELELLLETLRVGETRFFRHGSHVAALTDIVIPALQQQDRAGPVRAWSAGCATGEEAYTLAMVLRKLLPPRFSLRVRASDISAEALEVARRGVYREAALAHVPAPWKRYGLRQVPGEEDAGTIAPRNGAAPTRRECSCHAGPLGLVERI